MMAIVRKIISLQKNQKYCFCTFNSLILFALSPHGMHRHIYTFLASLRSISTFPSTFNQSILIVGLSLFVPGHNCGRPSAAVFTCSLDCIAFDHVRQSNLARRFESYELPSTVISFQSPQGLFHS